jgi:hypothetical protein
MANQQRLSDREAVSAALSRSRHVAGADKLKDC